MLRLPIGFAYTIMFLPVFFVTASAQVKSIDSSSNVEALKNAYSAYSHLFKENSRVYNGPAFSGYFHRINGHPFFESPNLENGSVLYDGILYPDINLAYDIVQDQVIIDYYNQQFNIQLIPEKIREFSIGRHHFVRILADSVNSSGLTTGFYERVYRNAATVLVKRTKQIHYPQRTDDSTRFIQYDSYFVRMADVYHAVNTRRSLFNLFGKNKSEVRKHLRKNKINFKKDPVVAIIEAVRYHELRN
jgi:hypothetical protein